MKAEEILKDKLKNIHFTNSDETFHSVIDAMQEYAHHRDRDFKLLVRDYFHVKVAIQHCDLQDWQRGRELTKQSRELERKILSDLERFTKQEVESLPFKD